jgi:hypothetical protein
MRFRCAVMLMLGCAACAGGRTRLGDVTLRPYGDPGAVPTTYGVQEGRLVSPNVDVVVDPDGCARGMVLNTMTQICKQVSPRAPTEAGDVVQRWTGPGGDFTLELQDAGKKLRMDGYLRIANGNLPLQATVPLGQGPQWDELRRHPVLLAIAAAATGIRGEPERGSGAP